MIVSPPPYEEVYKKPLNELQHQMAVYDEVEQRGDVTATEAEAQRVASAMRNVGNSQKDPKVKKEWHKKAEKFTRAAISARKGMMKDVGGIVGGLLSIPFRVVGVALSITGGILHGVGGLLVGAGDAVIGAAVAGSSRDGGNNTPVEDQGILGRGTDSSRNQKFGR